MNLTMELSAEKLTAWKTEAAARGLSLEAWLQAIADEHIRESPNPATDRPVWEVIASRVHSLNPEAFENQPADGASEHDHYLYGHPKLNR